MNRTASAALLVVLSAALAGCGDDDDPGTATDPGGAPELEFTETGGCGDAFFWATTSDDKHAVVITTDVQDRSQTEPTVVDVSLPDPAVEIELWEGTGLTSLMCNDVVEGEVSDETPVVEGAGTITIEPRPEGHTDFVDGKLELSGLVTDDGTELPDLAIKATSIGFYAG
jgi:hypothetical protein